MSDTLIGQKYDDAVARMRTLAKSIVPNLDEELPWKLVTHRNPDTDAYACLWLAARRIVGDAEYTFIMLPAGQRLAPEDEAGYRVLYMDTGGGPLDQHGIDSYEETSSFRRMCEHYGFAKDEALWPLINLTVASDNIHELPPHSVHYVLSGLSNYHRNHETKVVDWELCLDHAFAEFDILYGREKQRLESIAEFHRVNPPRYTLENGLNVCHIWGKPHLREAAFELGADVVMWTILKGKGRYYLGIQLSRRTPAKVEDGMASLMAGLRIAEAKKRGISTVGQDLRAPGQNSALFGGLFLLGKPNKRRLILCGSRSATLSADEYLKLTPEEVNDILNERLSNDKWW